MPEKKKKKTPDSPAEAEKETVTPANQKAEEEQEAKPGQDNETPAAEPPEKDETEKLSEELAAANKKTAELNDQLLRTMAEFDNFRKRTQKEKEAIHADTKSDVIAKLLPVLDNFERASAADGDFDSYKKGIEMTVKQLLDIFTALGVQSFGEAGEEFDPNLHNGVLHIEDENLPENSIAEVLIKGYKLGEKVIRHATVKVAN